jgi:hypothetical protein
MGTGTKPRFLPWYDTPSASRVGVCGPLLLAVATAAIRKPLSPTWTRSSGAQMRIANLCKIPEPKAVDDDTSPYISRIPPGPFAYPDLRNLKRSRCFIVVRRYVLK